MADERTGFRYDVGDAVVKVNRQGRSRRGWIMARVEQKNWTHVRQLLGYDRIDRPGPGMRRMGGATRLPAPLDAYPLQTENAS